MSVELKSDPDWAHLWPQNHETFYLALKFEPLILVERQKSFYVGFECAISSRPMSFSFYGQKPPLVLG